MGMDKIDDVNFMFVQGRDQEYILQMDVVGMVMQSQFYEFGIFIQGQGLQDI